MGSVKLATFVNLHIILTSIIHFYNYNFRYCSIHVEEQSTVSTYVINCNNHNNSGSGGGLLFDGDRRTSIALESILFTKEYSQCALQ